MKKRLSNVVVGIIVLCVVITISACGTNLMGVADEFKDELYEEFGYHVVVPEFNQYPLTGAVVQKGYGEYAPNELLLSYAKEKGELQYLTEEEKEMLESLQEEQNMIALYGPYEAESEFIILFMEQTDKSAFFGIETEKKIMNEIDVYYYYTDYNTLNNYFIAYFEIEEDLYMISFLLKDEWSEDEMFDVLDEMTKQMKK